MRVRALRLLCTIPFISLCAADSVAWAQATEAASSSPDALIPSAPASTDAGAGLSLAVRATRPIDKIPGSVSLITQAEIKRQAAQSSADVLRTVPGLHVVSEEGIGLRLNIGIRGLDPNRSRKVLVLEDGVPITLNPYGVPEQYYTPPIERMERIEVLKGSGQILYGPQTIGGVINFLSRDPPTRLGVQADVRYGSQQQQKYFPSLMMLSVGHFWGGRRWDSVPIGRRV